MNHNRKILLLLIGFVFIVSISVWLIGSLGDEPTSASGKRVYTSKNWASRYHLDQKHPYDLYHFNQILTRHLNKPASVNIIKTPDNFAALNMNGKKTYIFVGADFGVKDDEIERILEDVNSGSMLILSFDLMFESTYPYFFNKNNFFYDYSRQIQLDSKNRSFDFYHVYQNDSLAHWWKSFDTSKIRLEPHQTLVSNYGLSTSEMISYGEGKIILQSIPELYQNYQVLRKDGYYHAQELIRHIPQENPVYWLEFGRLDDSFGEYEDETDEGETEDNSYLQFILSNRSTRVALLIAILAAVLFLIFRTRRVQPIVPVMEKKKNMTLAYAETMTGIFYSKRNPYSLLNVLKKNFYNTVSRHFFIDLSRKDEKDIIRLAEKSNFPKEEIQELIRLFETKKVYSVDEEYVSLVSKKQRYFYLTTGIITEHTTSRIEKKSKDFRRQIVVPGLYIMLGIAFVLAGFYYLTVSKNFGVVLWPAGLILIFTGILQLRKPLISISSEIITFYPLFRKKRSYRREEIVEIVQLTNGARFRTIDNKKWTISMWEMSIFDKKQFKRYISGIQNE